MKEKYLYFVMFKSTFVLYLEELQRVDIQLSIHKNNMYL